MGAAADETNDRPQAAWLWDQVRWRRVLIAAVLALHAGLLAWPALRDSPTVDEPAHLAAGLWHWEYGRFNLYAVNPPLVRMVAAVPVLLAGANTDWSTIDMGDPRARQEFTAGTQLLSVNGRRSFWLMTLARWACIPLSMLGAVACYGWARQLYGPPAGLVAMVVWSISPMVLAFGHLITADLGAAALALLAGWLFWRWLRRPRWEAALAAGVALGLAELAKFTLIVFFGLWPVLWLIWLATSDRRSKLRAWRSEAIQLLLILVVALYLINAGYGFEGSLRPLGKYQFASRLLRGGGEGGSGNRFAGSLLGRLPVPLPANYVLGIDLQKQAFERGGGRPSYLAGQMQGHGWWYYYLYGLAVKVPLGTWLLALAAIVVRFGHGPRWRGQWRDELVLLLPALVIFVLVSCHTTFNRHMRYVLPAFPFAFVWISQAAAGAPRRWPRKLLVAGALLAAAASSLWVWPHSLSYFNLLAGGPTRGHEHLLGSNLDWGQDLLYLQQWLEDHPEAKPLHLAYYGLLDPRLAGLQFDLPPMQQRGREPPQLEPGWYAVSVNLLRGYSWPIYDATGQLHTVPRGAYEYFWRFEPAAMAGYTIWIFHIAQQRGRAGREAGAQ